MMTPLQGVPLKRKVTVVILLTCSVALLLACGALALFQIRDFREIMARDFAVLADVMAKNTRAALAFRDDRAAAETLQGLQAKPNVAAACLYDANGVQLASYSRGAPPEQFPKNLPADGVRFEQDRLVVFQPVMLDGTRLGTLYLHGDLSGLQQRLLRILSITGIVLVASCLAALLLSSLLQRVISHPILELTEAVQKAAEGTDDSLRLPPGGGFEVDRLKEAFNRLLAGIEERNRALRSANQELRQEVTERKSAEDRVQSQLARLEMLHKLTRAISERQDLRSIFQVVVRTLEEHLPVDFCCIALYLPDAGVLTVNSVGVRSEALAMGMAMHEQATIPIDQNGLSRCVHGELVYEPDISRSEFPFPKRLASGGLKAMVAAPLLVESQVFGAMIAARRTAKSFSSSECEFLRQLNEHVALAAHQAQIYTALQQAYDDLRQSQQTVMQQERLRALGQMASGIAHDINNAISPVALYTESLLDNEPNLSARARDYLRTIQHAIEDVTQTVARMREFYRQRDPQFTLVPVRVNPLITQVIDLSRARWSDIPQRQGILITVETALAADLPLIMGSESEIREALVNLVFNAVDAMPKGGTLTLRTRLVEGLASARTAPCVRVEVSDTGLGMDEDTRRRCLEPFFTTKGERGTGLGLAMVYGMVRRHDAEIEIDSLVGRGTTFAINFPVAQMSAPTVQKEGTMPRTPQHLRILVVDDDPLLIKSLRDTLETDGHHVITANGGLLGVETFKKTNANGEPFDVVFTDLGMPGMDGRQVASAIKTLSPSTPVILLTGWGQRLVAEGEIPPFVDQVLSKPPKLRELREALAQSVQPAPL